MKNLLFFLITFVSLSSMAANKVATVKLLRGKAEAVSSSGAIPLKVDDWLEEGSVVKTAEKSFVKLIFVDKSTMNVGPLSEMKIERFDGKDAGVIDVVKGQIRSQVTKDYLQIKDKDQSKLFMKTKNAVMGVRGTDFMITSNGLNTATVLFEGEVVFNSLPENHSDISAGKLESIVDQGVRIEPGEFSVVQADLPQPTVPSTLNLQQRESLEKNPDMETSDRTPASAAENTKTVVPDGLSGTAVSNASTSLKSAVAEVIESAPAAPVQPNTSNAAGFASGDMIKPANGSFLHIESGSIIPPPPGSVLDPNTNTYIPASGNGTVAKDGSFVPPAGVAITNDGKLMVSVTTSTGEQKVVEVLKAPPVITNTAASLTQVSAIVNATPALQNSTTPIAAPTVVQTSTLSPTTIMTPDRLSTGAPTPAEYQVIQKFSSNGVLNINVTK